jgi:single-stranded-DNA-specific exonuclease
LGQIERTPQIAHDPVIIVSHPAWVGGVLGLAAGNLARDFYRPAIVFREFPNGEMGGSARSIQGIDISKALRSTADLLSNFGGHPMAAGLSLHGENLPDFKRRLFTDVKNQGFDPEAAAVIDLDEELSPAQVTSEFHSAIRKLAPFGQENPPLLFCSRRLHVTGTKPLGRTREHFQIHLEDEQGNYLQAVWWNTAESDIPTGWFDLAYSLSVNEYKGKTTLQAVWTDFHIVEEPEEIQQAADTSRFVDFRSRPDRLETARLACKDVDYLIYQEPYDLKDPASCGRDQLRPVSSLILSSIPPSWEVFARIILRTEPKQIYLVFDHLHEYSTNSYLKQIYAPIRYAVENREGVVTGSELAGVTNAREETANLALKWLAAAGKISITNGGTGLMSIEIRNSAPDKDELVRVEKKLATLLEETASFQRNIRKMDVSSISAALTSLRSSHPR